MRKRLLSGLVSTLVNLPKYKDKNYSNGLPSERATGTPKTLKGRRKDLKAQRRGRGGKAAISKQKVIRKVIKSGFQDTEELVGL